MPCRLKVLLSGIWPLGQSEVLNFDGSDFIQGKCSDPFASHWYKVPYHGCAGLYEYQRLQVFLLRPLGCPPVDATEQSRKILQRGLSPEQKVNCTITKQKVICLSLASSLEAIAFPMEAIASRLEAIALTMPMTMDRVNHLQRMVLVPNRSIQPSCEASDKVTISAILLSEAVSKSVKVHNGLAHFDSLSSTPIMNMSSSSKTCLRMTSEVCRLHATSVECSKLSGRGAVKSLAMPLFVAKRSSPAIILR